MFIELCYGDFSLYYGELLLPHGSCKSSFFVFRYGQVFSLVAVQDYKHEGIENSDAVNMSRSRMLFPKLFQNERLPHK